MENLKRFGLTLNHLSKASFVKSLELLETKKRPKHVFLSLASILVTKMMKAILRTSVSNLVKKMGKIALQREIVHISNTFKFSVEISTFYFSLVICVSDITWSACMETECIPTNPTCLSSQLRKLVLINEVIFDCCMQIKIVFRSFRKISLLFF